MQIYRQTAENSLTIHILLSAWRTSTLSAAVHRLLPILLKFQGKEDRVMNDQSKYYVLYRFDDGSSYKNEIGKDGVTADDMRNLRNTIKVEYRANTKEARLDAVSIEASFIDEDKHWGLANESADTMLIVETADEYESLHRAIAQIQPQQQELIHKIYFQGTSIAEIARADNVYESAISNRLTKIFKKLKIFLT